MYCKSMREKLLSPLVVPIGTIVVIIVFVVKYHTELRVLKRSVARAFFHII